VAVGVVHLLEVVEVGGDDADGRLGLARLLLELEEAAGERLAV
jgi:hypothetical protein